MILNITLLLYLLYTFIESFRIDSNIVDKYQENIAGMNIPIYYMYVYLL